jgi:hypothetical protein
MLLPAAAQAAQLPVALADVTAMMERVGRSSSDAVAEQIPAAAGAHVPLAQCTIFSFQGMARPAWWAWDRARTGRCP